MEQLSLIGFLLPWKPDKCKNLDFPTVLWIFLYIVELCEYVVTILGTSGNENLTEPIELPVVPCLDSSYFFFTDIGVPTKAS